MTGVGAPTRLAREGTRHTVAGQCRSLTGFPHTGLALRSLPRRPSLVKAGHRFQQGCASLDATGNNGAKETRMPWTWRVEDADGDEVDPGFATPEFSSQGDAETWLGEVWQELADSGAAQVLLLEDRRTVYGPMPLTEVP